MTFVGVRAGVGRSTLRLTPGPLAPRLLSADATGAKIALVATSALLLGGDHVQLEVDVGPGAWLEIVETAGTVAYDAAGESSSWNVRVAVDRGGLLIWHGEPFVLADGSNTLRRSVFELGPDASTCIRETVILGRTGERGGAVRIQTRVSRCGLPVLVEDLELRDRERRELPGVIGSSAVIDTVTVLGAQVPGRSAPDAGTIFELDASAGTVGRFLRTGLAGSPAAKWWPVWSRAARDRYLAALH